MLTTTVPGAVQDRSELLSLIDSESLSLPGWIGSLTAAVNHVLTNSLDVYFFHTACVLPLRRSGIFLRQFTIVAPLLSLKGTLGMAR